MDRYGSGRVEWLREMLRIVFKSVQVVAGQSFQLQENGEVLGNLERQASYIRVSTKFLSVVR